MRDRCRLRRRRDVQRNPFGESFIVRKRCNYVLLTLALATAACGDDLGFGAWSDAPDTTFIYSASRPELIRMPSAYDIVNRIRVSIEGSAATGTWDFALLERSGAFVMAPESFLTGSDSRAGIALTTAATLAEVREAPRDTALFRRDPVTIEPGKVYIIRSRREACFTFGAGVRYAKLRALEVDAAAGTYRFEVVRNPNCNDRALIPPDNN